MSLRPEGPLKGALADLHALHLTTDGTVPLARGMQQAPPAIAADATPENVADWLLNDSVPQTEREALLKTDSRPDRRAPAAVIRAMTRQLPQTPGSAEEYRRIPWIWRVAVDVGKTGSDEQVIDVLRTSLPRPGQPLQHWQAVVIGGGLINGISLSGRWPHEVLTAILHNHPELAVAWQATLDASVTMATETRVPTGTRYDAIRIAALLPWPQARNVLSPWLQPDSHPELQMGAVSGLSDVPEEDAAKLLITAFKQLTPANQTLAREALHRTPARRQLLDQAQLSQ
ncbi:MAG: hypothetical protein ACKO2P_04005 [Planctomycetota bacterium]